MCFSSSCILVPSAHSCPAALQTPCATDGAKPQLARPSLSRSLSRSCLWASIPQASCSHGEGTGGQSRAFRGALRSVPPACRVWGRQTALVLAAPAHTQAGPFPRFLRCLISTALELIWPRAAGSRRGGPAPPVPSPHALASPAVVLGPLPASPGAASADTRLGLSLLSKASNCHPLRAGVQSPLCHPHALCLCTLTLLQPFLWLRQVQGGKEMNTH